MRIATALPIALLLLAAGCSSPKFYWYHTDRTIEQAQTDYCACQDKARQEAADMVSDKYFDRLPPPPADTPGSHGSLRGQAGPTHDPRDTQEAWRQRYEQSALAGCMRGRGYVKLRPDRVPRGVRTRHLSQGAVAGR
jgi:hypothetical protein